MAYTLDTAPPELLDLALELYYADDADTMESALALAADLGQDLEYYLLDWDRVVSNVAAEAGDWDTAFAALPF